MAKHGRQIEKKTPINGSAKLNLIENPNQNIGKSLFQGIWTEYFQKLNRDTSKEDLAESWSEHSQMKQ